MATTFERNQLTRLETLLGDYLDAITAILTSNVTSYQLDTGQGRQSVTRHDVPKLQETYGLLWQQYDALSARCGRGGATQVVPPGALPYRDRL